MAEIKLLPVSGNGRQPYWNSISGFDFDVCIVIGMSFYICLPNFVVIERLAAELHCYDVISIFQDGGNRVENVLPGSGLVTGSA